MLTLRRHLPSLAARLSSLASTAAHETTQTRAKITVEVHDNQLWKAMKAMTRKLKAGNIQKEWNKRKWFTPPAQQRVLNAKETAYRLAKKNFKAQMNAIANRQKQGF